MCGVGIARILEMVKELLFYFGCERIQLLSGRALQKDESGV